MYAQEAAGRCLVLAGLWPSSIPRFPPPLPLFPIPIPHPPSSLYAIFHMHLDLIRPARERLRFELACLLAGKCKRSWVFVPVLAAAEPLAIPCGRGLTGRLPCAAGAQYSRDNTLVRLQPATPRRRSSQILNETAPSLVTPKASPFRLRRPVSNCECNIATGCHRASLEVVSSRRIYTLPLRGRASCLLVSFMPVPLVVLFTAVAYRTTDAALARPCGQRGCADTVCCCWIGGWGPRHTLVECRADGHVINDANTGRYVPAAKVGSHACFPGVWCARVARSTRPTHV